uniref:Coronin n=1 Tax=Eptatretus burgeri TaxID=7764 RepID=A0A8C4Q573_EPTBU
MLEHLAHIGIAACCAVGYHVLMCSLFHIDHWVFFIFSTYSCLMPFFDEDTGLLLLAAKVCFTDLCGERVCRCMTEEGTRGLGLLPKRAVDVMACEVMRALQLIGSAIVPISYVVPRKNVYEFHSDLFPDTLGATPATQAQDWWQNHDGQVTVGIKFSALSFCMTFRLFGYVILGPTSKFRHLQGTVLHRSSHISNLVAVPLATTGGQLAILELSKPGKLPPGTLATVQNVAGVTDFCWDPFNPARLAVAGEDAKIRLWHIPSEGLTVTLTEPEMILTGHTEKIYSIKFHPLASDVLASSSYDHSVRIWDVQSRKEAIRLEGHTEQIFSLAWSPNGQQLATACKDGRLRIYDPRSSTQPCQEGSGPPGTRGARVVWVCDGECLLVSGFDSPDVLRLGGWGEGEDYGLSFLRKVDCEVRDVEFARALRLGQTSVEPIAFSVPRVKVLTVEFLSGAASSLLAQPVVHEGLTLPPLSSLVPSAGLVRRSLSQYHREVTARQSVNQWDSKRTASDGPGERDLCPTSKPVFKCPREKCLKPKSESAKGRSM